MKKKNEEHDFELSDDDFYTEEEIEEMAGLSGFKIVGRRGDKYLLRKN